MFSRILENINLIFTKAFDLFFSKHLLKQAKKVPWIDNKVGKAATKKKRLRQQFLMLKEWLDGSDIVLKTKFSTA